MNVLMLSIDRKILVSDSQIHGRMIDYGTLVNELHIILFVKEATADFKLSDNVFVHTVLYKGFFSAWFGLRKKIKQIKSKIDLVTSQDASEIGFMALNIAKKLKAKVELQIHTDIFSPYFYNESRKNKIRVWLAKRNLPKADNIRVVSKRVKTEIHNRFGIPYHKVSVLPVFTNVSRDGARSKFLQQKYPEFNKFILTISRLEKEKNVLMLIKAMNNIVKRFPRAALIIVGDGSLRSEYENLIASLGLSANVIFEGWQSDVSQYLRSADMFVHTSNYEGFGMTLVEAAFSGCPIITTNVGLVGDVLDTESVTVVEVGDIKALVSAIERLIKMPEIGELLSRNAKERVSVLPDKSEYLRLYKENWERCVS